MRSHTADGHLQAPSVIPKKQRNGLLWRRFFCYHWPMKKLSEHGLMGQLAMVAAIVATLGVPIGAGLLWAADIKINQKYATDSDLRSVQGIVQKQVNEIKTSVDANTKLMLRVGESVDGLTLAVLDLQRDRLAAEIREIEISKEKRAAEWTTMEARNLRAKRQALSDLNTQRKALFERVIQANQ